MNEMPAETALGYRVPSIRQFGILLENRVGRLMEVLSRLDDAADVSSTRSP